MHRCIVASGRVWSLASSPALGLSSPSRPQTWRVCAGALQAQAGPWVCARKRKDLGSTGPAPSSDTVAAVWTGCRLGGKVKEPGSPAREELRISDLTCGFTTHRRRERGLLYRVVWGRARLARAETSDHLVALRGLRVAVSGVLHKGTGRHSHLQMRKLRPRVEDSRSRMSVAGRLGVSHQPALAG